MSRADDVNDVMLKFKMFVLCMKYIYMDACLISLICVVYMYVHVCLSTCMYMCTLFVLST